MFLTEGTWSRRTPCVDSRHDRAAVSRFDDPARSVSPGRPQAASRPYALAASSRSMAAAAGVRMAHFWSPATTGRQFGHQRR